MQTVTHDEVTPDRSGISKGMHYSVTNYFGDSGEAAAGPQGFLIELRPEEPGDQPRHTMVAPHFHLVRQFQVVVGGDEPSIGKRAAAPITFHYADPSSPYGPIDSGPGGVAFLTLRPRGDKDAHWMPGSRDEMLTRAGRNILGALESKRPSATQTETLWEPHDDGLASYRVEIAPGQTTSGPAPTEGGGQYLLITRGSLARDQGLAPELSLMWVAADEPAPTLTAGPDGCELLAMQFPREGATIAERE